MQDHEIVNIPHDGVKHETELAYLIDFGEEEVWIPKSQIKEVHEDSVDLTEYIAYEKGLI